MGTAYPLLSCQIHQLIRIPDYNIVNIHQIPLSNFLFFGDKFKLTKFVLHQRTHKRKDYLVDVADFDQSGLLQDKEDIAFEKEEIALNDCDVGFQT